MTYEQVINHNNLILLFALGCIVVAGVALSWLLDYFDKRSLSKGKQNDSDN